MRRTFLVVAAAAAFVSLIVFAQSARYPAESTRVAAEVAWGPNRTTQSVTAAAAVLRDAINHPQFGVQSSEDQAAAYSGAGWAAIFVRDFDRAREMFTHSVELTPGAAVDRLALAKLQWDHGDKDESLRSALQSVRDGVSLKPSDGEFVWSLVRFADTGSTDRKAFLELLSKADWKPRSQIADNLKYQLALARLRAGRSDELAEVVRDIQTPELIIMMRSDKRFDAAVDRASAAFDARAGAERQVTLLERAAPAPRLVSRETNDLLRAMLVVGRAEDVAKLAAAVLKDAAKDVPPRELAAILEQESGAYLQLHRLDEAVSAQEKAAAISVDGGINVNQTLDLASLYCDLGRGEDAARAAASVEANINPFGRVVQAFAKHCAATLTGNRAGAIEALEYLEAHKVERAPLYLSALLRENRIEDAARALIATLRDELTRGDTLLSVQTTAEYPSLSADSEEQDARWKALLARKDVLDAINTVGRIEVYDINR